MNLIATLRQFFMNVERSRHMLEGIMEGVANQTELINRHMMTLTEIADRRRELESQQILMNEQKIGNESKNSPSVATQPAASR